MKSTVRIFKSIIRRTFNCFGLDIHLLSTSKKLADSQVLNEFSMSGGLARCAHRGMVANSVIDVGASDGRWSNLCMQHFPKAEYLLIEAQSPHADNLEKFKRSKQNVDYIIAAAGATTGHINFNSSDLWGGLASETPFDSFNQIVPMTTIDSVVETYKLKAPYIIKLDTHGYEIPILEGAKKTLLETALLVIETYNFQICQDSLKYYELCNYLNAKGFSSIDIVDLLLRNHDLALWQMDTFYVPLTDKVFLKNSYI